MKKLWKDFIDFVAPYDECDEVDPFEDVTVTDVLKWTGLIALSYGTMWVLAAIW